MNFLIKFRWSTIFKTGLSISLASMFTNPECSRLAPLFRLSPTTTVGIQTLGKEHRYLHYHIHGTLIMRMAGVSTANPDGTKGKDNAD